MGLADYVARQLRTPSGWVGRRLIAPLLNRENAGMNGRTLAALELQAGARVLEVGFGGGGLLEMLTGDPRVDRVAGIDPSPDMIALCRGRFQPQIRAGRLELATGRVEAIPFPEGHFSHACTVNTLYFWSDLPAGLGELHRVVGAGGRVVVCFSSIESLEKGGYARHGFSLHSAEAVRAGMEAAGFRGLEVAEHRENGLHYFCAAGTR